MAASLGDVIGQKTMLQITMSKSKSHEEEYLVGAFLFVGI